MARHKKRKPRRRRSGPEGARDEAPAEAPTPAPAGDDGLGRVLALVGWGALGLGTLVAAAEPGSLAGALAATVALLGGLLTVGSRFFRDRASRAAGLPRKPSPVGYPLGTALLIGGAAMLLYPTFLPREEFLELSESFTHLPLVAVTAIFCGIAFLIDGLDRQAPSEGTFALETPGGTLADKLKELNPKHFFYDTWKELDAEAARARAAREAAGKTGYDWRPLVVLCSGAVFLSLMEYFGHAPTLHELIEGLSTPDAPEWQHRLLEAVRSSPFYHGLHGRSGLIEFAWWSGWRVLGFFLLPAFVVKVLLREKIADHGLQTRGFLDHAWIYALFFAIVLVAVVVVSYDEHFATYYPFYKEASRSWFDFWTWELLYAAQFFSLEFFFRGFWLKASKTAMGSNAIFAMVVPYCMIHFGKPFPETIAAILAGVVLGTLALRTRSIWSGFLIHVSVAISMDVAALLQTTGLPERWWPAL